MNNERYKEYINSAKWREIAKKRFEIDGYKCVCCGCTGTSANPLECHHVTYRNLYHEEDRIYQDLLTLCHVCHKQVHRLMNRKTSATGRHGWKDANIPQVHAYNISGTMEHIETD